MNLSFETLRLANRMRLPEFRNSRGEYAHTQRDGSDWSPAQWLQATVGELGELANVRKKYERGDLSYEEYCMAAKKEIADVQIYLDIFARRLLDTREGLPHPTGVSLTEAVVEKFNEVSVRVHSVVRLVPNSSGYVAIRQDPEDEMRML